MAGHGPAPKDPGRAAGHRQQGGPLGMRAVPLVRSGPQPLPADLLDVERGEQWHPATVRWWTRWQESPLSADWTAVEWSELEVTARLHQKFMAGGDTKVAAELRQRMAKFGATSEDRARLRIVMAEAEEKDPQRPTKGARDRYSNLRGLTSLGREPEEPTG